MSKRGNGEGSKPFKRKDGRWEIKYSDGYKADGKPNRKSLYGKTRKEVVEKLIKKLADKQAGILADPQGYTLGSWLDKWLEIRKPEVAPTTFNAYRCALKKLAPLRRVKLDKVDPVDIKQIYAGIINSGLSPRTAQITHTTLYSAINDAVSWKLLPYNFMADIKAPKVRTPEIRVWNGDEIARFLEVANTHRLYALFYVALTTGLRRGELLALRWQNFQVNEDGTGRLAVTQTVVAPSGRIIVKEPKTETSKRTLFISEDVVEVLEQHRIRQGAERKQLESAWEDNDLIFPSTIGTYLQPRNLSRTFDMLLERAKVTKLGLHGLRHTHASILIKEGIDVKTVSERLGHANVAFTLRVYQHLYDEQRSRAAIGLAHMLKKQTTTSS